MRRTVLVRCVALGMGLLACPLLAGCLVPVGAAWPSVTVTPPLQVSAAADQVHAFRVEVCDVDAPADCPEPSDYVLAELPVRAGGWVLPQAGAACDYGWYWNGTALTYWKLKRHTVLVRLYRPGCQTVEVKPWGLAHEVDWRGVADLAGQEKAVDDLLSTGGADYWKDALGRDGDGRPWGATGFVRRLADGSRSAGHRSALLFAASEYQRLAKGAPDDAPARAIRERMEKKAVWVRELAGK